MGKRKDPIAIVGMACRFPGGASSPGTFWECLAQGRDLGLRGEIEARLRAAWSDVPEADVIRRITLHYLDGSIQVEIELPLELALGRDSPEPIRRRFKQATETVPDVSEVRILFG